MTKIKESQAKEQNYEDNAYMTKRKRGILIAVTVVAVLESLSLLGLSVYWRVVRADVMKPKQLHVCTLLENLATEKDREKKKHCPKVLKEQKNSTRCCGILTDVMDELLATSVSERYDSNINPELVSLNLTEYKCKESQNEHPIARLVDFATHRKAVQVGVRWKLFWNSQAPSYTKAGLGYLTDDGTIYVEETDIYFVFVQLKTQHIKGHFTEDIIRHSVHLISNGTEAVILEDVRSMCETSTGDAMSTSVMGAMFKLKYGDRLYVATSHPQNITPDPHNNYFSIHIF